MLFQTLDDKNECVAVFANNKINKSPDIISDYNKTWSYSGFLKGKEIEYANLYCYGKTLDECCPEDIREEWTAINNKLKSFISSFLEAKVSLNENCFFDLTPEKFLIDYCNLKNKICDNIFKNYEKPKEYNFYRRFSELLHDIKYRPLNIDIDAIQNKLYKKEAINFYRKVKDLDKINYNMFGSITGRLTVKKNSFPILTFPKNYRSILKPTNDWFVCFDMNAAELRMALALMGKEQPAGDLHQWCADNLFNKELTRSQAKETATSWLYNSNSILAQKYDLSLSAFYDKQGLKNKYWINGLIHTPYDRKIVADEHHAISYLNQSSFIDLFHRQIIKIDDYLKDHKSFVAFMIHDEFVLDMSNDEKDKILDIIKILQDTPYGIFTTNVKVGKSFGEMKKLNLKV